MTVLLVSGTDTDVGKTIVTAAIAATMRSSGRTVVVYKPTQTGVNDAEPGDVAVIARLTGVPGYDGVRLRAAMAPRPAAVPEDASLPTLADHAARIHRLHESFDVVLVEGAGGLLVELTEAGDTIATLAGELDSAVVVVVRSALGTLNHTALTLEALQARDVQPLGLVIGSWPATPSCVELSNRAAFEAGAVSLLGAIPAGAGVLPRAEFVAGAPGWLPGLPG